ncbi:MAG: phosphopantothenoylcysteine decarboxylase [Lentisphaeria bacterium]|nr:phosphopantothenoylcysteine decarboxylase [Lentisphaeria bacterium]
MKILVTAGPTRESIDPVRYITNRSSGKMGYALAEALVRAGHQVVLVSGPVTLSAPEGLDSLIRVETAAQMAESVKTVFPSCGGAVMCAAVADYRPAEPASEKIHKSEGDLILRLERTEDILLSLGRMKSPDQVLVGFAAETEDLRQRALGKMERKNLDWIIANRVGLPDRGFQSDDNAATAYARTGRVEEFPLMPKKLLAQKLMDLIFPGV